MSKWVSFRTIYYLLETFHFSSKLSSYFLLFVIPATLFCSMDAAQWPQGFGLSKPVAPRPTEKKPRPQKDEAVKNCPRCNSTNTKFCYYNNYNLSQPRYFCKSCRRYWTEGGTLRNVPVGGGSRKNKRSIISTSSSSSSSSSLLSKKPAIIPDLLIPCFSDLPHQNPNKYSQDLNLAYPHIYSNNYNNSFSNLVSTTTNNQHMDGAHLNDINEKMMSKWNLDGAHSREWNSLQQPNSNHMDFLKNGISSSKGLHTFMPMPISDCNNNNTIYSSSSGGIIPLHDFKPTLNFSLNGFDNHQNVFGSGTHHQDSNEKILFPPLDNLKQVSSTSQFEHNREQGGQESNSGYFNGMFGGYYSW